MVKEIIGMHTGPPVVVHGQEHCAGQRCCVHNPSIHSLWQAPLTWMQDLNMMWRRCMHGQDHPDPDDLDFQRRMLRPMFVEAICSVHMGQCDGCCAGLRYAP